MINNLSFPYRNLDKEKQSKPKARHKKINIIIKIRRKLLKLKTKKNRENQKTKIFFFEMIDKIDIFLTRLTKGEKKKKDTYY